MKDRAELIRFANHELLEKGNFEIVSQVFAKDYQAFASGVKKGDGHVFIHSFIKFLRNALPDLRVAELEFFVETESVVVWQRTLTGTHQQALLGIPPSCKKVQWTEIVVSHFEGDKITSDHLASELAGELMLKPPSA